MLNRFTQMISGLEVDRERMKANMDLSGGTTFSQSLLLALVEAGMTREEAYGVVQKNALGSLDSGRPFSDLIREDEEITRRLSAGKLDAVFDPSSLLANTGVIFRRVFGEGN
jgi:adenylosuccinate lyase